MTTRSRLSVPGRRFGCGQLLRRRPWLVEPEGMSRQPLPLPPELGSIFAASDALAAGVTPAQLRRPSLQGPVRGVRSQCGSERTLQERAEALSPALPRSTAFSHTTAAQFLGLPLPWGISPDLHLTTFGGSSASRVRRPGVVGNRRLEGGVTRCGRLIVTDPSPPGSTVRRC